MRTHWDFINRGGEALWRQIKTSTPILLVLVMLFLLVGIWWLAPRLTWHGHPLPIDLSMQVALTVILLLIPTLLWALLLRGRYNKLDAERKHEAVVKDDLCLPFVRAQEQSLDHSLTMLRQNMASRNYLYKLPWYLVLGQETAGKTSFINRSNQNFALTGVTKAGSSKKSYREESLAYTIDWWIGNEAVLIDPPGELISQQDSKAHDSVDEPTDRAGDSDGLPPAHDARAERKLPLGIHKRLWDNLVDWLGRNRGRRPLNGIVLIVDIAALLSQLPSDRKALAILLRTRLYELTQQLGTRLPLYVVLTKFDLLEGFDEFFARLPRAVRDNIFGFTFTLASVDNYDAWLEELATRYDTFIQQINEQVFDALADPHTLEQRERIFSLVRQLAGMRPTLFDFLGEILSSDRYAVPALTRGMYFSSVYQQGLLSNAFVTAAARSYGMSAPLSEAKSDARSVIYFAQQLFQQVIYPEAGLAGDNVKVLASKRRLLLLSSAVAVLGCLLVIGGWRYYFGINHDQAGSVLAKSKAFSGRDIDTRVDPTGRNLLVPLDQIRDAVSVYGDYREAWPLVSQMGLYQGREIGPKVDAAYLRLLSQHFLPALASGVIDAINAAPPGSNQRLAALRVYRMIEDRQNRRASIVEDWMSKQWQSAFPGQGDVQKGLMTHLDYAMKYADADLPQYRPLVGQVQQELRQIPLPQRVYMGMKQDAQESLHAPLDLRNEIGPAFDVVYRMVVSPATASASTAGVPAAATAATVDNLTIDTLLTAKGFRGYFEPHSKDMTDLAMIDQWVLGERGSLDYSDEDKKVLAEGIRSIYTADYIDTWRRSLNQFNVSDLNDMAQAVTVLENITGPSGPFRRLLETVRDNTVIYQPVVAATGAAKQQAEAELSADAGREQAMRISRAFAPLTDLLIAKGDKPSYFDETMQAIGGLYTYMKAVQDSPDRGKAALKAVLDRFALTGPDPIASLQRIATGLPEPLNGQVKKLADQSSQVLMIEALRELEKRWDSDVYSFYSERLASRYPFNPASNTDASLEDFEAFFGPQGRLQQFNDQYLKLFLKDNLDALYSESRGGYLVRADVMTQLQAADRIRDAFFNNRGALNVQFIVEPLGLTPNRRSSVLDVDGQLIPYNHGPSNPVGLIWPNTLGDAAQSKVTMVNLGGNSQGVAYHGPWSLFRLLSQGHLGGATATSVDLGFEAGDGVMRYRITAEKANNPFTQRSFNGFALPRKLLQDAAAATPEAAVDERAPSATARGSSGAPPR